MGGIKSSWINYTTQNDHGFNFSFPSSWTIVNGTHLDSDLITLTPPHNYDLFGEKMTFGIEKLQSNMSLHEYSNKAQNSINDTARISPYRFKSLRTFRYGMGEDCIYP
ncbi:hypothetical protein [Candidatus Nitrosocosmicus sp. R]